MHLLFVLIFSPLLAFAQTVATYSYSKSQSKNRVKTITFKELKTQYAIYKKSTFNPPAPQTFFQDLLRFKMGVEVALHDPSLVKDPNIIDSIVSRPLKIRFEQEIYKALTEMKTRKQMRALDKESAQLPDRTLKKLYAKDPEYNFFYISVNHPIGPTAAQIKEAENRARKIYAQVRKSKKEFTELVALNSDEKNLGVLPLSRSRASILPNVYKKLRSMSPGEVSPPIRVATGYQIVKLNEKTPFARANKVLIKANYFNERRTKLFNKYVNGLKKYFSVKIVNKSLIGELE